MAAIYTGWARLNQASERWKRELKCSKLTSWCFPVEVVVVTEPLQGEWLVAHHINPKLHD